VVDEASMVDVMLMQALARGRAHCRLRLQRWGGSAVRTGISEGALRAL
jgi:hypothetical protein